ncbi:NAD(P)-dependent dehydrogenase (short-subunit alcohol dehydrogenase family) [Alicyclobacillus sacchari]|uniref:NAD(P)-dependent dehydrogenase (Short-subunit alcohol dehydrogenase family) n=1 Tax=Alicyclobacillus sacchari TaxID=392010 RepID=A0A4R8LSG9_9BACL|nr:SDR family oxidoreductase [Alicyclobacillus sacchari]TDY49526.1 NAD(P)-dependent dehydrogenase (short-subunit alcohol dehydrogenase family) [Alicyclobacillus sacchari]
MDGHLGGISQEDQQLLRGTAQFALGGKRVVVTGASRGIGRALAIGLAACGADVALVGRDREALAEVQDVIAQAFDARVASYACDLRNVDSIRAMTEAVVADGTVDVLVNNAGVNIRESAFDVTPESWQTIIDTDLRGAFFTAQAFGKHMVGRRSGSIVNISSVGGHVALRTGVVYAAAKAGLQQMTKVLAMEWGKHQVRVNAVGPWYFRTPLTAKLLDQPDYLADILARTPLGRVGELHELVGPVVFFASDASTYVTGQTLFVDGGMTIFGF